MHSWFVFDVSANWVCTMENRFNGTAADDGGGGGYSQKLGIFSWYNTHNFAPLILAHGIYETHRDEMMEKICRERKKKLPKNHQYIYFTDCEIYW